MPHLTTSKLHVPPAGPWPHPPRSRSLLRSGSPQASFITAATFCATGSQAESHSADSAFWVACGEEACDGRTSQGVCSKHTVSHSLIRLSHSDGSSPKHERKKNSQRCIVPIWQWSVGLKAAPEGAVTLFPAAKIMLRFTNALTPAANQRFTMQLLQMNS